MNAIARFEVVAEYRFRSNARDGDLSVGVLDVGEEHVPRDLTVDADRLNLFQDSVASAFQHTDDRVPQHKIRLNGKKNGRAGSSCDNSSDR